ncbi:N-6 DNA methylase [Psychrobacter ciconiae]|uniref:N-6 DNA methylase n=1 Tax=Psychrobacter ciconiae TaxID=1553449 RepID=UPI001917C74F|nr:N-6 DNA methylase [Psychrobacter ciconiae]
MTTSAKVKAAQKSSSKRQSIEPAIADLANSWLRSYGLGYCLEQESPNANIREALSKYESKGGGVGGNRPDAQLLLKDKDGHFYPVLIEYKGLKGKLEKLNADGQVDNQKADSSPNFKHIKDFAVNGAVHYANALLHYTNHSHIIAIGMTGYKDAQDKIHHDISAYYVARSNLGVGQKIGQFEDLSFLADGHFDDFIEQAKQLDLGQEQLFKAREQKERAIDASLVKLNNDIYRDEKGLGENERVYLVAATIIANLGVKDDDQELVEPLTVTQLDQLRVRDQKTDGQIILERIEQFLDAKAVPTAKKELITRTLANTLLNDNINKIHDREGQSQLRRVFEKIIDDLGIYYKIGLTTDFTGKLFNEMYGWLGFAQDKLNDVVLTPSYVATLLAKLARVHKDSYVWDFATGSAGLLVAAMNEMLADAKATIGSPQLLKQKELSIKANQLLGLEILSSVYMLAILNMILMGDGSSNLLNVDSVNNFAGEYGLGKMDKFPADAFILNPPYSAEGNGMIFVEKAFSLMNKGYASVIIQGSAGSGKAKEINRRILQNNSLIASIKMPVDIFVGKSSVQTYIYVFKVGEAHHSDNTVKFIDFSNDGYTRTARKKASVNLRDTNNAKVRYQEVVELVRFGAKKRHYIGEQDYYEGTIDPLSGSDWNQSAPIDTKPTLADFQKTISDYLAWEVSNLLKQRGEDDALGK